MAGHTGARKSSAQHRGRNAWKGGKMHITVLLVLIPSSYCSAFSKAFWMLPNFQERPCSSLVLWVSTVSASRHTARPPGFEMGSHFIHKWVYYGTRLAERLGERGDGGCYSHVAPCLFSILQRHRSKNPAAPG